MASPLLTEEQAQKALEMNLIRQDQLDKMFPKTTVEPEAEIQAVPTQMSKNPIGPAVAPDYIPYSPTFESRMGEAMGYNPTATMGDLNPFQSGPSPERIASAQEQQKAFMAPMDISPISTDDDQYLAADREAERQKQLLSDAANNYPGAAAYNTIRQGIESQGQATREHSRAQALEYQNAMDALENYNKDEQIANIAQNKRSETALNEMEQMRSDIASTKIAPRDVLGDKSTGEKILAWTALVLGGIGGGGRNSAADALSRAVDRDVEAQKAQYQTKREGLENKQTIYGQMMNKFKNDKAAMEAAKMGIYKTAELKLLQLGAKYGDAATKGKVQEQLGKLDLLQEQAKAEFMNAMMGGDDPYKNMDENQAKRYVPGYGFAPDPDRAKLANTATALGDSTISSINTILSKAEKAGRFDIGANDEISQLVKMLRSENKEAIVGGGAVTDTERNIIADIIKDPSEFFANRAKAQKALAVIRDAAARTRDVKLKSYGVRPAQSRYRSLEYDK